MFWSSSVPKPTKTLLLPLKKVRHREARLNNLGAGGSGGGGGGGGGGEKHEEYGEVVRRRRWRTTTFGERERESLG
jgi:hypothetical protein